MTLIDEFMPEYDFNEVHAVTVAAAQSTVRSALDDWRPSESFLWRWLLRLRGLGGPAGTLRQWAESNGFLRLAESETEVVYGQAGRFWAPNERGSLVSPKSAEEFLALKDPGYAVAAMNIRVDALGPDRSRLHTETRVRGLSPGARRRFRLYWLLIRPFSGLLRRSMLNGIKRSAIKLHASESASKELVK